MATSLNQDDYLKTALRLPRDLHAKIQEAAAKAERSMNAEIVARLDQSLSPQDSTLSDVAQLKLELLEQQNEFLKKQNQELGDLLDEAMDRVISALRIDREELLQRLDADSQRTERDT